MGIEKNIHINLVLVFGPFKNFHIRIASVLSPRLIFSWYRADISLKLKLVQGLGITLGPYDPGTCNAGIHYQASVASGHTRLVGSIYQY